MSRANGKNLITFGAPGTGKSYSVLDLVKKTFKDNDLDIPNDIDTLPKSVAIRTTFHPDSDYSTFVGCYKPQDLNGNGLITYKFTPQAFINAYLNAWSTEFPYFLIIEEINRGNCAQIFGDVFQILDRKPDGSNEYDITPDADIQKYIEKWFKANPPKLVISNEILEGKKLYLPKNLTILATMNTSDQSLFPMDSAFKRRWEWNYQPIEAGKKGRKIKTKDSNYSWWSFVQNVNDRIYKVTKSEDKQLGYWFVKVDDDNNEPISKELFISKVIFYLWSDVFKDYGNSNDSPFAVPSLNDDGTTANETKKDHFTFQSFFGSNADENLKRFLDGLKVGHIVPEDDKKVDKESFGSTLQEDTEHVNQKKKGPSEFVNNYMQSHPKFVFASKEKFTGCRVQITFPYRNPPVETGYIGFTESVDKVLETIGKDSIRLFKNVNGGLNGSVISNNGDHAYGHPKELTGDLKGYFRCTNKSGNDIRDMLYEMLNLVEKEEDLFIISAKKIEKNAKKK